MTARVQVDALTGIRGVAAWLVVLYHIRLSFAPSLPDAVVAALGKGYLAVDLFFVLSGFVLWLTWGERLQKQGWRAASDFLRKRLARVWPLHAVILMATVGWALLLIATGRPVPPQYSWPQLPLHILLVQNWGLTHDLGWNDPSWSISTELAAYAAFAALVPVVRVKHPLVVVVLLLVALDRLYAYHGESNLGADIAQLGLWRCLTQFGCGVMMCMVWQHANRTKLQVVASASLAVAIALLASGLARETLAVPIAFASLVPLVAASSVMPHNPLSSRVAVWLGEISYSTYLVHFLLWIFFKLAFVGNAADVPLHLGALFLALTLAASVILHRGVEIPARKWLGGA
jgi:peptidoglycan/LPS O-acetylase OafA/YrhL